MYDRAIEIIAIKLAQAEVNHAIAQAQLEQAEYRIKQLEKQLEERNAVPSDH